MVELLPVCVGSPELDGPEVWLSGRQLFIYLYTYIANGLTWCKAALCFPDIYGARYVALGLQNQREAHPGVCQGAKGQ